MNRVPEIVIILDYACIVVWGAWLLPSAWRNRRAARADRRQAWEALAGGWAPLSDELRQHIDEMAAAAARHGSFELKGRCLAMADQLRQRTGLPDTVIAIVLAQMLDMAVDYQRECHAIGMTPSLDAWCGMFLCVTADLSSLERDLTAR